MQCVYDVGCEVRQMLIWLPISIYESKNIVIFFSSLDEWAYRIAESNNDGQVLFFLSFQISFAHEIHIVDEDLT